LLKKSKPRLPTEKEFLTKRPQREDFEWYTDEQGYVHIQVPKFTSTLGISFCKLIRKENVFSANLDAIGSRIWKQCDGEHTVKDILNLLKKEFHKEKNIDQRLYLFLQQMYSLHYLTL
jgi:hypothetical protein